MKHFQISDFSLEHTLDSGQFFMYEYNIEDNFYYVVDLGNIFKVKQDIDTQTLIYDGIEEKRLIEFFSLDINLKDFTLDFSDKHLLLALEKYWGLRLLRQDLWQCMIGFVCSSASNIPKIKKNLRLISQFFGEEYAIDDKIFYTFPSPGSINNLEKLIDAKTGYRAKYIFEINNIVKQNPSLLDEIKSMEYIDAKKELMKLPGIGSKVADCICLFGLGHKEAFPIDTWVIQIIEKLYLKRKAKNLKEIENFIKDFFQGHRGLKQQYLFHYMRNL